MYLLYLDESGTHPSSARAVVGGLAVFERAAYWLKRDLSETVARFLPYEQQHVPIHAPSLRTKGPRGLPDAYASVDAGERRRLLDACYSTLLTSRHPVLFATVVDKDAAATGDAYRIAFEDVVSRFDLMLARFHAANRTQRGVVVMSESSTLRRAERAAGPSVSEGTQWGRTRNLSEVPLFVSKSRTRLLQAAGLVTNEVWGRYEKGISRHFDEMLPKFDREGTRLHGLTHRTGGVEACWCPACFSYRASATGYYEGGGRGEGPPPRRHDGFRASGEGGPGGGRYRDPPGEGGGPGGGRYRDAGEGGPGGARYRDPPGEGGGPGGGRYRDAPSEGGPGGGGRYRDAPHEGDRRPGGAPRHPDSGGPPPRTHPGGYSGAPPDRDPDRQPESNENRPMPWEN